jgi:hypothetical protein
VIEAVNDLKILATHLSGRISQKIAMLHTARQGIAEADGS